MRSGFAKMSVTVTIHAAPALVCKPSANLPITGIRTGFDPPNANRLLTRLVPTNHCRVLSGMGPSVRRDRVEFAMAGKKTELLHGAAPVREGLVSCLAAAPGCARELPKTSMQDHLQLLGFGASAIDRPGSIAAQS